MKGKEIIVGRKKEVETEVAFEQKTANVININGDLYFNCLFLSLPPILFSTSMLTHTIIILKSEVADLESKVKSQSPSPSPYLIPDAPTLCTQLHIVRQLIATKNFVVIVPIQGMLSIFLETKVFFIQLRYHGIKPLSCH